MAVELTQGPIGYERAEYRYDILGRRTEKRLWKASTFGYPAHFTPREPDEVYRFSWVGMQLASEHHSSAPNTTVYHVYNDSSYTSLARIHCFDHAEKQTTEVYYSHCALNGLPEALTNTEGQMVWQGQYGLWGNLQRQVWPMGHLSTEQNLRFQGQYFDKETGLHYNTFRYYSPDLGRFTQQDPIGLAGGLNLYQYAPNPLTWVDPWGLANRPNNGSYHIFHDFSLNSNNRYSSDAVQFNRANTDLINKLNTDSMFRRDMLGRYPQLGDWLKNGDLGRSPPGLTWHHHEDINRLVLVDRIDHRSNHKLYHPTGKGGRDMWGGGKLGRQGKLDGLTGLKC